MCRGIVSTGSEGIKQHEIITIRGNRVRAGQMPMLVIDVVQLVFGPGLFRVVCRQGEMTLQVSSGFSGRWTGGVMDRTLSLIVQE